MRLPSCEQQTQTRRFCSGVRLARHSYFAFVLPVHVLRLVQVRPALANTRGVEKSAVTG